MNVAAGYLLGQRIVDGDINAHQVGLHFHGGDCLTAGKAGHIGDKSLDDEDARRRKLLGGTGEASKLLFLGEQGEEGIEDDIDQGEFLGVVRLGETADLDQDILPAGFGVQFGDHSWGSVDTADGYAAGVQRKSDSSGADAQLQSLPARSQLVQAGDYGRVVCRI